MGEIGPAENPSNINRVNATNRGDRVEKVMNRRIASGRARGRKFPVALDLEGRCGAVADLNVADYIRGKSGERGSAFGTH